MKTNIVQAIFTTFLLLLFGNTKAQYLYDSVFFEMPTSKIVIDAPENNRWQIGQPGKTLFNEARTGTKAIMTDTIASYPINDTSSFIYIIRNPYTQTCYTGMSFWHKFDTDSLTDVGIIEASYDGGKSWLIAKDTNDVMPLLSRFWWDADYHAASDTYTSHLATITGKSDGWIQSRFNWNWWIPVKSDTIMYPLDSLMIRFTFISDGIDNGREGWLIDDILTSSAIPEICSGLDDHSAQKALTISPNPFKTSATITAGFDTSNVTFTLYNSTGKQLRVIETVSDQNPIIQRDKLPAGVYYLVVSSKGQWQATKKFVIMGEE